MKFAVAPLSIPSLLDSFGFLSGWPSFLVWLGAIILHPNFRTIPWCNGRSFIGLHWHLIPPHGHCWDIPMVTLSASIGVGQCSSTPWNIIIPVFDKLMLQQVLVLVQITPATVSLRLPISIIMFLRLSWWWACINIRRILSVWIEVFGQGG